MENQPELIRDQMQETRTALTEKLEALETQVSNTVQSATAAVTDTVQAVKDSVADTVGSVTQGVQQTVSTVKESVKDAFDLPGHVQRHPWASLLGSVAVGYLGGRLLNGLSGGSNPHRETPPRSFRAFNEALPKHEPYANGHGEEKAKREEAPGLLGGLANAFGAEFDTIKALGISAVAGLVRDVVTQSVPGEIGGRLKEWMDGMTEKMGAKPLSEPVLQQHEGSAGDDESWRVKDVSVKRQTMPGR